MLFHVAKQHGLASDIKVPESTSLLVIPDAGSNDVMQCQELSKAMDIIILDHHICDAPNPYATVVNNQMCDYPNKDLSGVGIVYKFCRLLTTFFGTLMLTSIWIWLLWEILQT